MNLLLETKNLTKMYSNNKGIQDINIQVEQGDIYGFLGPNGSGKTTTIRTILDLIHADSGEVLIDGIDINHKYEEAIINVGTIVETPRFYEYFSGYVNLKNSAMLYKDVTHKRILEVLKMVGLEKRAKDKVKTYSLGMKQRLGIARALLHNPKLVILDEPTNGLDPQGMKEVRDMIKNLSIEKGITFLISTHLLTEVELLCNKVGILKNGRMIAQGKVNELLIEDTETIEIITKDLTKVEQLVNTLDYIRNHERTGDSIIFQIDNGSSSKLIHYLITNDIEISYVIPKNKSLEKYFFEMTEGE